MSKRVLAAFGGEAHGDLWWDDEGEVFIATCNDVFAWACADGEEVTDENVHLAEAAKRDLSAIGCEEWTAVLFCARVRGMRPQGAMYDHIPEEAWPLFDACGPKRETGFGNPKAHPAERTTDSSVKNPDGTP